jgi:hypothetical protein
MGDRAGGAGRRAVVVGAACALLAGCGGTTRDDIPGPSQGDGTSTSGYEGRVDSTQELRLTTVKLEDRESFDPKLVVVGVDQTVVFRNIGDFPRRVRKQSGPGGFFRSPTLSPGDSYRRTFNQPGTFVIADRENPSERMEVRVAFNTG